MYVRFVGDTAIAAGQRLRIAIAPTATSRHGRDLRDPGSSGRDPLSARRDLVQLVAGVEHELRALGDELENVGFAKYYGMWADAEDFQRPNMFIPLTRREHLFGAGDAIRWRARPGIDIKASYERSVRMPSVDDLFGSQLAPENLGLRPERSHNVNLGVRAEGERGLGQLAGELNTFARLVDDFIMRLDTDLATQNVDGVRVLGIEGSGLWTLPGGWAEIDGSVTLQDVRNTSGEGPFGAFKGDRMPNQPWLLGSLGATVRRRDVMRRGDELTVFSSSRYVRNFFVGWESAGDREFKDLVPSQLIHGAGITYALRGQTSIATTLELQNLTDARAFDSFGVERPGRALFAKITGEL